MMEENSNKSSLQLVEEVLTSLSPPVSPLLHYDTTTVQQRFRDVVDSAIESLEPLRTPQGDSLYFTEDAFEKYSCFKELPTFHSSQSITPPVAIDTDSKVVSKPTKSTKTSDRHQRITTTKGGEELLTNTSLMESDSKKKPKPPSKRLKTDPEKVKETKQETNETKQDHGEPSGK
jgi:hypothetical protein